MRRLLVSSNPPVSMKRSAFKAWLLMVLFVVSTTSMAGLNQTHSDEQWSVLQENKTWKALPDNASNNGGFVNYMVMGYSSCDTEIYGIEGVTFMSMLQCPDYTILRSLAEDSGPNNEIGGDEDLLNISGWTVNDAAYLGNGEHLLSLSKAPYSTALRSIFNETIYDGHSHLVGKMDSTGSLSAVGGALTFSHDQFNTAFDIDGNLFVQGVASNESESPFISIDGSITTLDWTTIGHGPGCSVEMEFNPAFLTYFNRTTNRFDWLFQSPFLEPQPHATSEALEGTFLFSTIGTPAQTFDCGTVPGTHTFGQHTASAGEILASVSSTGEFHYAHNTGLTSVIANSKVQVGVGNHGYVYQSGVSSAQHLVSSDGIKTLASNHPFVCERQNETAYMHHGSPWSTDVFIWNQSRPYHYVDMSKMYDYGDPQTGRCVANHESLIFLASWTPTWSTQEMPYWSAFSQNSDDDWFADVNDDFPFESTQWRDTDGDGFGDNPTGRLADMFVNEATQWEDQDGDGLGDNQSGVNPDPFLFDFDNDGYNDSIDPLPKYASPGDLDNDGVDDEDDWAPTDAREWLDSDGDGVGDNADLDDDNDGWTDTDEARQGTDPFSSDSQPVEGFEVIIPGTQVSLGAWDLIGMFGGIPLFIWIMFGLVTRNGRTARFEQLLAEATTREELESIANQWEYSLMLRLIGPHQGIRLERIRTELDDRLEAELFNADSKMELDVDQTHLVERELNDEGEKEVPELESSDEEE